MNYFINNELVKFLNEGYMNHNFEKERRKLLIKFETILNNLEDKNMYLDSGKTIIQKIITLSDLNETINMLINILIEYDVDLTKHSENGISTIELAFKYNSDAFNKFINMKIDISADLQKLISQILDRNDDNYLKKIITTYNIDLNDFEIDFSNLDNEIIKYILSEGYYNCNNTDKFGNTILMWCVKMKNTSLVKYILENKDKLNVDFTIKNKNNKDVFELAEIYDFIWPEKWYPW